MTSNKLKPTENILWALSLQGFIWQKKFTRELMVLSVNTINKQLVINGGQPFNYIYVFYKLIPSDFITLFKACYSLDFTTVA